MTPTSKPRIVAIDGPAGAGKSTVSRRLAEQLGYVLLDTGAIYRAVALAAKRAQVSWDDDGAVGGVARGIAERGELRFEPDPRADPSAKGNRVLLAGEDVSKAIREPSISMGASKVSAVSAVRAALLDLQRHIGASADRGVVAEGRDIGTVVFPETPAKFFLTASLEVRAARRQAELAAKGQLIELDQVAQEVAQRDKQDSEREVAPLRQAADAKLIDSTGRSIDDVVSQMLRLVEDAFSHAAVRSQ